MLPASDPRPPDGANDVDPNVVLGWSPGTYAVSHDIYFGTDSDDVNDANTSSSEYKGNQALDANSYDPCGLEAETTYYWRIDEVEGSNTWKGEVWSFTTIPFTARNPCPVNAARGVLIDPVLRWDAGFDAVSHDVYFGKSTAPPFKGNQTAAVYEPGVLAENTTYWWRIDEVGPGGTTTGQLWGFITGAAPGNESEQQINIGRVMSMPSEPSPYLMRDWKQVARDFDDYVFSFTRTADSNDSWWQTYPIIWWDQTRINFPWDTFGMPSYIGDWRMTGDVQNRHEAIVCIPAVIGATLCGIDKSNQWCEGSGTYENWVIMQEQYFNIANGENLALNSTATGTGHSFWYEIHPSLLYCQLMALYPDTGNMENEMRTIADLWYQASVAMGGGEPPCYIPDFTHTAFDFDTMKFLLFFFQPEFFWFFCLYILNCSL